MRFSSSTLLFYSFMKIKTLDSEFRFQMTAETYTVARFPTAFALGKFSHLAEKCQSCTGGIRVEMKFKNLIGYLWDAL